MFLRAIAVAAPEYPYGRIGTTSLSSRDPISLYNACRYAAFLAENGLGAWGFSNWRGTRAERRKKFLLLNSFTEERSFFTDLIEKERPHLLLIGAMTMCLPGAIECAKIAKEILGDRVVVVLGGRHVSETVYVSKSRREVFHHVGSPLILMAGEKIPKVFDLVISGEGEFVIAELGEHIARCHGKLTPSQIAHDFLEEAPEAIPGNWIAGRVENERVETAVSKRPLFNVDMLPASAKLFGISSGFNVFPDSLTGHVFSDMSSGCTFDCSFCSERRTVCGLVRQPKTAGSRLYRQMQSVVETVEEDCPGKKASAFVEDSIMLGGYEEQLAGFADQLSRFPLDLKFGCQLTVDLALKNQEVIQRLVPLGLDYVFVGLETAEPRIVGGMSKDVGKKSWLERSAEMLRTYVDMGLQVGFSVLFGLGESQQHRINLLDTLSLWRSHCGNPVVISYNWATQHPLKGRDFNCNYDYTEWSVSSPEYVEAFKDFGEATERYSMRGVIPPSIADLQELHDAISCV